MVSLLLLVGCFKKDTQDLLKLQKESYTDILHTWNKQANIDV